MTSANAEAATYARLSRLVGEEDSTERQAATASEWCERQGLPVVETFTERGSGFKRSARRPAFAAAVSWVLAAPGRTLVVYKLDRLSRQGMGKVGTLLDDLEAAGSRFVSVRDGLDSSVPGHRMVIAILSEQARQESVNTSTRTADAKRAKRAAGKWLGGAPPHGYRRSEGGRLVQDPATAPVVRRIVDEVLAGRSLVQVCRGLNADGVPSPGEHLRSRGVRVPRDDEGRPLAEWEPSEWRQTTLSALLRSAVLAGFAPEGRGGIATDTHGEPILVVDGPAVITLAERRRLLAHLEARTMTDKRNGRRIGAGRPSSALLGNLARCGRCGGPMRSAGQSYYCEARRSGGSCPGMTVSVDPLDSYVMRRVLSYLAALAPEPGEDPDPRLTAVAERWLAVRQPEAAAEAQEAEAEAAEVKARLATLEDEYLLHARIPQDRYERLHALLSERLAALESLAAAAPAPLDLGPLLDFVEAAEAAEAAEPALLRDVVRLVVDRVTVRPVDRRGERFSPSRVTIDPLDT